MTTDDDTTPPETADIRRRRELRESGQRKAAQLAEMTQQQDRRNAVRVGLWIDTTPEDAA